MEEEKFDWKGDLLTALKTAQVAAEEITNENDRAMECALAEINRYRNLLRYVFVCLVDKPIFWASPEYTKIEKHIVKDVKVEVQTTGFFGEEYNGDVVIKVFVDDGSGYFIGEELGKTVFLTEKAAKEIAGKAVSKKI